MFLTHTSSIQDNNGQLVGAQGWCEGDSPVSLREWVEGHFVPGGKYYTGSAFMLAPPGTAFEYSNFGFALLGYVVESISGVPFDSYTRQHIFQPLGMTSTAWHLADRPRRAGHAHAPWAACPAGDGVVLERFEVRGLPRRGNVWGHPGGDFGASTLMVFRPSDGTGVIVLANGDGVGSNDRNDGLPSVFAMARRLFQEAEGF